MMTLVFFVLMMLIFGKICIFGIKAAWGITKLIMAVIFSPVFLTVLFFIGLAYIAFPILVVLGIVVLVKSVARV